MKVSVVGDLECFGPKGYQIFIYLVDVAGKITLMGLELTITRRSA
jgi:hypothetical protein